MIKQVVQELQAEFPSIKTFVTLSPIPGLDRWLDADSGDEAEELTNLKKELKSLSPVLESIGENDELIKRTVLNYLLLAKQGKYPADPVARFHLGNGAKIHQVHTSADLSEKGISQSRGTMVNYLYDLRYIERNHEQYVMEGEIDYNDKLKSLLIKL